MAVHQLVAGARLGDAITNEALALARIFREWSPQANIFCPSKTLDPKLHAQVMPAETFDHIADPAKDTVILHLSIGSSIHELYRNWSGARVILYHNITPPGWFSAVAPATAQLLRSGLQEVRQLAGTAHRVWADSRFNANELEALGYGPVEVLPLVIPLDHLELSPAPHIRAVADASRANLLFVGRGAPNKRFEDLIRIQAALERMEFPTRLLMVGSFGGNELYASLLQGMVKELGLRHCHFEGPRPQAELNAYYAAADIFLCMSEHEGFCAPLIEAMVFDLPIVAFDACAVPETLACSGVLVKEKDNPWLIAEMIRELQENPTLNQAVREGQRRRLNDYQKRELKAELNALLGDLPH